MNKIPRFVDRVAKEPPFRLASRLAIKYSTRSVRLTEQWDLAERPHYLTGVLKAADQACSEGVDEICVIEFGVAAGAGLLELQECAEMVERETGVRILVFGFDSGAGLPNLCGDYRDHPDQWRPMDYPMNEQALRSRLGERTTLVIGNVGETVPRFVRFEQSSPVGFVSFDLDLYSSTMDAMQVFLLPESKMLRRVPLYFDDVDFYFNHRFAGELLAIDDFNELCQHAKIDKWRGLAKNRVFPNSEWLNQMYVAHNIRAISEVSLARPPAERVT